MQEAGLPPFQQLVDHLFRHESGKMIAVLTRLFGMHNLELAEDVVQEAFLKAMQVWKYEHIPHNPAGWLMQVARNRAIDIIRRKEHFNQYSRELASRLEQETEQTVEQFFHESEIADSQLRMIFTCCHPALKEEDQVALTLKTLSGFGVAEIARALLSTEETIRKRIYRARSYIQEQAIQLEIPAGAALPPRLNIVHTVLYLLFNEGYHSQKAEELIRKDLCAEAMRLCLLLSEHPAGNQPATFALLALMCFQASRFETRQDANNNIVLLPFQDRRCWDQALIHQGYTYLHKSAAGQTLSVYHIESAIAAEHCMAPNFEQTNWPRMLQLYDLLQQHKQSPAVQLNRAVVLARLGEVSAAITAVNSIPGIAGLLNSQYIYNAVLGDLYLQHQDLPQARLYLSRAYELTPSIAEKELVHGKLEKIQPPEN